MSLRNTSRFFAVILLASSLRAQTQGEITGEIADASGAVMPGVVVTVTNENTNVSRQGKTNDNGASSLPAMLPATSRGRSEKTVFQTFVRAGIELQVQQVARIDLRMPLGQTSETVTVAGEVALLTTESATTGTVIENKRIVELPLNGRNFL